MCSYVLVIHDKTVVFLPQFMVCSIDISLTLPKVMSEISIRGANFQIATLLERRNVLHCKIMKQMDLAIKYISTSNIEIVYREVINLDQLLANVIDLDTKNCSMERIKLKYLVEWRRLIRRCLVRNSKCAYGART